MWPVLGTSPYNDQKVENSKGRVVTRSNNNANANGGLVYTNANDASSRANSYYGSRLEIKVKASSLENIISRLYQMPRVGNRQE